MTNIEPTPQSKALGARRSRGRPAGSKNKPPSAPSITGAAIIDWIESRCYVPEGKMIGQLVRLARWQKREIERIYDNPAGTRLAILSFGRCKNGKTALAAFLLLANLCGPIGYHRRNSQ